MGLGIDIGSRTIKVVELAKESGKWKLISSGVVAHNLVAPEYTRDDKELGLLSETLKKLLKEARVSSREVALALPEPQVFTRTIKFPGLTDQEIASAVKWEAEQYIPIPVQEAVIQHQILGRSEAGSRSEVRVLLIAAPKVVVEKYTKVAQNAGLNTVLVETQLLAMVAALAPDTGTAILVDFGAKSTNIAISKDSQLVFARSIPTAGEALTRAVAQSLGMAYEQAEEYKKTYGLSTQQLEGKIKIAINPVLQLVIDEIKKAMHFYEAEEQGEKPASIVISGGSAGMPEIIPLITQSLGLEVVLANPFLKVSLDPKVARVLTPFAPLYSVAVGLAMGS